MPFYWLILPTRLRKKEQKIVDLCAGNGAVGLFLTPKSSAQIYEVEIQPRLADMAKRSIDLNGLEERVTVINDDLNNVFDYLAKDSIDTVTCNPPYFEDRARQQEKSQSVFGIGSA